MNYELWIMNYEYVFQHQMYGSVFCLALYDLILLTDVSQEASREQLSTGSVIKKVSYIV